MTAPARPDLPAQIASIHADADAAGDPRPGRGRLAELTGATPSQVRTALAKLATTGERPLDTPGRPLATVTDLPSRDEPTDIMPAIAPEPPASASAGDQPDQGKREPGDQAGDQTGDLGDQAGDRRASGRDLATTVLFYLTASVGLLFSADSSYLLASERLGLHGPLLWVLFGFLELFGLAGAAGLAAAARRGEHGGVYRLVVWGVVAYNVYSALMVATPGGAIARVVASLVGVLALHLALGTEIRRARRQARSPLAWLARAHWLFFPWRSIGTLLRVASAHADAARARELAAIGDQS